MDLHSFIYGFNYFVLYFAILIMSSYVVLGLLSSMALRRYLKLNHYENYHILLGYERAPYVTIIAPAYNEGLTIKDNIQSLLSLNYTNYDVIVVNDGGKDNTMQQLIPFFDLYKVDLVYDAKIPTKAVKEIYKSRNKAFSKLTVIDKYNGGKADALNVGINITQSPYIVCIDVDCVMERDALLKLAKPLLQQSEVEVIAVGGVVRIANSCVIKSGSMVQVNAPEYLLPRIQVIEYLRAFILGRMAWAKLEGLLLISGAFGMFKRNIVIECGGYSTKTVGEDMELVVRMRRHMIEHNRKYKLAYIPDPLCWTEAPDNFEILKKQRSRWTRGTMETLWMHRKMMLNPRYGLLGLLSVPYWFVFEYLAPIIEFIGLIITVYFFVFQYINLRYFLILVLFVYVFAVFFSVAALFAEEFTFKQYKTLKDLRKLFSTVVLEPVYFHPFTVYAALLGNWDKMRGKKVWGNMQRKGFGTTRAS
jgi:poly-beta-1,6-N-acetyl-D-glucosamine synthase